MALDYHHLAQSAVTTAGTTLSIYTNPAGTTTCIRQIWIHASNYGLLNFSETSLILYRADDSVGSLVKNPKPTQQFFARSLGTNETYLLDCGVPGIVLVDTNDALFMWHLSQTTINYIISGVSET